MFQIPMKTTGAFTKETITSLNTRNVQKPHSFQYLQSINTKKHENSAPIQATPPIRTAAPVQATPPIRTAAPVQTTPPVQTTAPVQTATPVQTMMEKPVPAFLHPVQKGQRVPLSLSNPNCRLKVSLGWNVRNAACDLDVSAFLLNQTGKVIGDSWFVFYGQTTSPDSSTIFHDNEIDARESITIDLSKLNPEVSKIVFVLTINEAFEKQLNFSMIKDAYIQISDSTTHTELVSFQMTDYYSNVTSMMIGELYLHHQNWKFNAIGNGVARDLAGLCELYGVEVI